MQTRSLFLLALLTSTSHIDVFSSEPEQTISEIKNSHIILHAALEGKGAIVGGLGMVVRDVTQQLQKLEDSKIYTVLPFYQFFEKQEKPTLLTTVSHYLYGDMVNTSVWVKDHIIYLLPPANLKWVTDVVSDVSKIYEPSQNTKRILWFNSAIAGLSNALDIDVLHTHGWQTGLSINILQEQYNPLRLKEEKKRIRTIATIHLLSQEQGVEDLWVRANLGLPIHVNQKSVNIMLDSLEQADGIVTVSKTLEHFLKERREHFDLLLTKETLQKIVPIPNGIMSDQFNPYSIGVIGDFELSAEATPEDVANAKNAVLAFLYKQGYVKDKTRPLMLFVGRFSTKKGVQYLPHIVEEWSRLGGQTVIMGLYTQDASARDVIQQLKEQNHPFCAIYDNLHDQQTLLNTGEHSAKMGTLMRFASTFSAIPSEVESCGLVAMENMFLGSLPFASFVQGLKDVMLPIGTFHPLLSTEITQEHCNSVSFFMHHNNKEATLHEITERIKIAFDLSQSKEYPGIVLKTIVQARSYDWKNSINSYTELYKNLKHTKYALITPFPSHKKNLEEGDLILGKLFILRPRFLDNDKRKGEKHTLQIVRGKINDVDKRSSETTTWIVNKNGQLMVGLPCHADYEVGEDGYGTPIACGGDLIRRFIKATEDSNGSDFFLKDEKKRYFSIDYIDCRSGHYRPSEEQFYRVLNFLQLRSGIDWNRIESTRDFLKNYAFFKNLSQEKHEFGKKNDLYHGKNVSVQWTYFGKPYLFVSFNCAGPADEKDVGKWNTWKDVNVRCSFGEKWFDKNEIDCVYVGNHQDNWYQSQEMYPIIDRIKAIQKIFGYERVIPYGGSMGGFAALAFSSLLNATDVIAFCPQIELKKWPYFDAFAKKYNLPDMFRMEDGLSQSAQLYCFYGYGNEHDRKVLEHDLTTMSKKNPRRLHLYPINYNEHTVMVPLQKSGCLGTITQSVIDNNDAPVTIEKLLIEKGALVKKRSSP